MTNPEPLKVDENTKQKRAHFATPLWFGDCYLKPDPAQPGRYRVTEGATGNLLGYLEAKKIGTSSTVTLAKINAALDELLSPRTVKF